MPEGESILIIEDDDDLRDSLFELISLKGYKVKAVAKRARSVGPTRGRSRALSYHTGFDAAGCKRLGIQKTATERPQALQDPHCPPLGSKQPGN
jgi:DNA-binding NtrC family response regulator